MTQNKETDEAIDWATSPKLFLFFFVQHISVMVTLVLFFYICKLLSI